MTNGKSASDNGQSTLATELAGKYLTFNLASEEYCFKIRRVREIIGFMPITPLPRAPQGVLGVINLRGKVIPVVDLRSKFGLEYRQPDNRTCIIVLDVTRDGEQVPVGVVVDNVNEVVDVKPEDVEQTPALVASQDTAFMTAVAKVGNRITIILDTNLLLSGPYLSELGQL